MVSELGSCADYSYRVMSNALLALSGGINVGKHQYMRVSCTQKPGNNALLVIFYLTE